MKIDKGINRVSLRAARNYNAMANWLILCLLLQHFYIESHMSGVRVLTPHFSAPFICLVFS